MITNLKNREPIRCYEGSDEPHQRFWKIVNAEQSQSGEAEIDFDKVISEFSWMGDEITPQLFKDDLNNIGKGGPVTFKVNSPGGDVIAASVIRSILADYPGRKTMKVTGVAASAAVVVVLAGDRIQIMDTAYIMIHDPAFAVMFAYLDIETLRTWLAELEVTKKGIAETYASKTGLSVDRINKMMADTTWFSASEAVKFGFADEIITAGRDGSGGGESNQANNSILKNYMNVPAALLNRQTSEPVQVNATQKPLTQEEQRLRDEIELNL